jgi:hypothetical protein
LHNQSCHNRGGHQLEKSKIPILDKSVEISIIHRGLAIATVH